MDVIKRNKLSPFYRRTHFYSHRIVHLRTLLFNLQYSDERSFDICTQSLILKSFDLELLQTTDMIENETFKLF